MSSVMDHEATKSRNGKRRTGSTRAPDAPSDSVEDGGSLFRPTSNGVGEHHPAAGKRVPEAQHDTTGALEIRMLPVSRIVENGYNPNEMTEEELTAYAAEVERLGRLPRPLVVRPVGDDFVLVDGEHGLKAARKAGLKMMPCEVIEVNDFEARRQSYQRNRHGTMNPVLVGQMFRQMQTARGHSLRALARAIGTSEGSVRNALLYAEAFDLRNGYAPDEARATVARLTIKQVRAYIALPEDERNSWLDEGADLQSPREASAPTPGNDPAPEPEEQVSAEQGADAAAKGIGRVGNATSSDEQTQLDLLRQAWEKAGDTPRRDFLAELLHRPEVERLVRELLPRIAPTTPEGAGSNGRYPTEA